MSTSVNAAYGQKGKKFSHVSKLWAESGQMEKGVYKGVFSYIFKRLISSLHFPFCHDSTCSLLTEDDMTRPWHNTILSEVYRVTKQDWTPEIDLFWMLFVRCLSNIRKTSPEQHTDKFHFRSLMPNRHSMYTFGWQSRNEWMESRPQLFSGHWTVSLLDFTAHCQKHNLRELRRRAKVFWGNWSMAENSVSFDGRWSELSGGI